MGSNNPSPAQYTLPPVDLAALPAGSEDTGTLALVHPTESELATAWTLSHSSWGAALDMERYHRRERFLTTVPLAREGGISHWMLTTTATPTATDAGGSEAAAGAAGTDRPVLASCESLRKRVLVASTTSSDAESGVVVREALTHGIASVYTDPRLRGRGYAGRMLLELGKRLRTWQGGIDGDARGGVVGRPPSAGSNGCNGDGSKPKTTEKRGSWGNLRTSAGEKEVVASVLFSDIGKKFYADKGWVPFPSTHVEFPPAPDTSGAVLGDQSAVAVKPLRYHDMPELCAADERLLRARLAAMATAADENGSRSNGQPSRGKKTTFLAFVPDVDTLLWHLMREDYMTEHIFGRTPDIKGALYEPSARPTSTPSTPANSTTSMTAPNTGHRMWCVWTRSYYSTILDDKSLEGNNLYILRFVSEEEAKADVGGSEAGGPDPSDKAVEAFKAIVALARREAREWKTGKVVMWNPSPFVRTLVARSGLSHSFVDREKDSISSLMWYGEGSVEEVEWVANEKYVWC